MGAGIVTDTGDTGWVLGSAALVLFMTPGLALFYGGLVRSKNVLGTMMQSVAAIAIVSVVWVLAGYTLAFGPDVGGVIGGLAHLGFRGVGEAPHALAPTVPHSAFASFQMMFAVITPALIAGAFAERVRFGGYVAFIALWSLIVYAPLAHWVWGGGFLGVDGIGALDFAGGTVVHISAGAAALAAALYVGKRRGYPRGNFAPHNVPMVVLGAGILWFGWFGFNAGSALGANGLASSALLATHLGAAGAMIGWLVPERLRHGKATAVGGATGAVAGLVAITPAAGFVGPLPALAIGLLGGAVCFAAVEMKSRLGYDDSLDAVGVHMVGGLVGALLTGVFASLAVNPAGADGGWAQLGRQGAAAGITLAFSFIATWAILKLVDRVVGFRMPAKAEESGVDLAEHGEAAYAFREHGRHAIPPLEAMSEEELAEMRERLVLEATARVLQAIGSGIARRGSTEEPSESSGS
ncbi:MAG: ammonium transporter [Actinobacteria bacterium]|nr:ammonium transporter [Actinomycetota bacterium]